MAEMEDTYILAMSKQAKKREGVTPGLAEAAAGVAPLAGMVGQKRRVHDPLKGKSVRGLKDLQKQLKPGDVILSTRKGYTNPYKAIQAPFGGSPFFHAEVYVGRGKKVGVGGKAGNPESRLPSGYRNQSIVVLRRKGLTEKGRKAVARSARRVAWGEYSNVEAGKAYFKEIFAPKVRIKKTTGTPKCVGPVCSTVASRAVHEVTGKSVAGKTPRDVLPADFLRDKRFKVVAKRMRPGAGTGALDRLFASRIGPTVARATMGATLAGGVLALRALHRRMTKKSAMLQAFELAHVKQAIS